MHDMIKRTKYLEQLIRLKDKQLIKVVTGIRRCGKSTLFSIFIEYLKSIGVKDEEIIYVNLENPDLHEIQDYMSLYTYINKQLIQGKQNYIFIDEIQMVPDFQKAVDGLFIKENCDVYITGSNAFLLSGELATLLSGRYIEIKMLPLSFQEYTLGQKETDVMRLYMKYIQNGSFPYILQLTEKQDIHAYLEGIYTSIVLKDVVARHKIADVGILEDIIRYMFDNIGNIFSSTKIANTMTSIGRKISVVTVEHYLNALEKSYILYRIGRYDVKGKRYLSTGYKYYIADIGLRYYLLGTKKADMGHILENVVYLELLRRGYELYIGKADQTEIDFVAIGKKGMEYYQVAYTVMDADGKALERELRPLESIKDHNAKYLLTMDYTPFTSHNGIKQMNVLDWLLDKDEG